MVHERDGTKAAEGARRTSATKQRKTRRQRKLQFERPSSSEACLTNKGTYSRDEGTESACLVRKNDGEAELVGGMLEKRAQLVEDA